MKDATSDEATVRRWWEMWPDAGVGIRMGAGRVALDVDRRSGGDAALESLQAAHGRDLPDTAKVATGGGWHLHFRAPSGTPSRVLAPGLELKGEGTYVVAPPSFHESGREYVWVDDVEPAQAPSWLLEDTSRRRHGSARPVADAIPEGERNTTLTSIAGTMRKRGMGADEIEAALLITNEQRCQPPLDAHEVRRIAESVERYPPDNGSGGPEQFDPRTGRPLSEIPPVERLSGLLEVVDVRRVVWRRGRHQQFIFWVIDPYTGKEAKAQPVVDILTLSNLRKVLHAVTGERIKAHRAGTEQWDGVQAAIIAAAEIVEVADDEAEEWAYRLGRYLQDGDLLGSPKSEAARYAEPFEHDGRVHVHGPRFADFLRQHFRLRADKGEVNAAFHELGFKSVEVPYRDDRGKRRTRCYWASPEGWTW